MPPNRHAVLSASSSHRWLHCNPSARLELEFEDRETEAAAEGTAAHALAEHKLRKALKMRSTRPVSKYDSDEMEMYTDSYLEFVLEAIEEARQDCPDPKVLIEQRLDFSCYVPDGFGTGDCLIVGGKPRQAPPHYRSEVRPGRVGECRGKSADDAVCARRTPYLRLSLRH